MYQVYNDEYLMHHGIKGQRWGVRRYQNPDGSLTNLGKRRLDSMSDKKLAKTFKKQIRKERAKQFGGSNRWMSTLPIGENSKKAKTEVDNKLKNTIENNPELKEAVSKLEKMKTSWEDVPIEEQEKWQEEFDQTQAKVEQVMRDYGKVKNCLGAGKGYSTKFVNGPGKDISVAKLQDLGYRKEDVIKYVDRLSKVGISLADF